MAIVQSFLLAQVQTLMRPFRFMLTSLLFVPVHLLTKLIYVMHPFDCHFFKRTNDHDTIA